MGQYSKPAMVLLCEQIQRDNPELDIELNAETLAWVPVIELDETSVVAF